MGRTSNDKAHDNESEDIQHLFAQGNREYAMAALSTKHGSPATLLFIGLDHVNHPAKGGNLPELPSA